MAAFISIRCCECREVFGMGEETYRTLKKSGHGFHCPFGHKQHFTAEPSAADELRRERDRLAQQIAQKNDEIKTAWATAQDQRERREAADRRASAARGQVTKLKKRAANGVCPCCNRTFADLARHMATKHKGFVTEEVQAEHGVVH